MRPRAALVVLLSLAPLAAAAADDDEEAPKLRLHLRGFNLIQSHLYEGPLAGPRDVFLDRARNELVVADTRSHRIGIFTVEGIPIFSFGGPGRLREPRRVYVDPRGDILVLEGDSSVVQVFSYRGERKAPLPLPGLGRKAHIAALHWDSEGNLYVGESSKGEVLVYDRGGRLRLRFGSSGDGEGQFKSIAGIATDPRGIFVLDHTGIAVQRFDRRGYFERGWGAHDMGAQNFSLPEAIVVDSKGRLLVTDALRHDIKAFDRDGKFLGHFAGFGRSPGNVAFPGGMAIGPGDIVYIAEQGNDRVQVFRLTEQLEAPPRRRDSAR